MSCQPKFHRHSPSSCDALNAASEDSHAYISKKEVYCSFELQSLVPLRRGVRYS
jgi:hypothetical protein